nr:IDEAL domain-containing protein [Bacillus methanolicus]
MMPGNNRLESGDWVKGKTRNGELIRGYIESVDYLQGIVKVHVIESDNKKTIGKTVGVLINWVEKLPVSTEINEEQILQLIDLALLTKDEQWFHDLSTKLNSHGKVSKENAKKNNDYPISNTRIGKFDAKGC